MNILPLKMSHNVIMISLHSALFIKVGLCLSKKKIISFNDSSSKMMKNALLFHLKSSFRSQDI